MLPAAKEGEGFALPLPAGFTGGKPPHIMWPEGKGVIPAEISAPIGGGMKVHILLQPVDWFRQLVGGAPAMRRVNRCLPSNRRCKQCYLPFRGLFSVPFRLLQLRPSRKNPNLCTV